VKSAINEKHSNKYFYIEFEIFGFTTFFNQCKVLILKTLKALK